MPDVVEVRPYRDHFAVFVGSQRVSEPTDYERALSIGARKVQQPNLTERACMDCGSNFVSTGPHHRLCDNCRRRSTGHGARR